MKYENKKEDYIGEDQEDKDYTDRKKYDNEEQDENLEAE